MIPQSWISECFEVFGVAENTKKFLVNSMNKWKLELTSNRVSLGNVEIRRGIFLCDSLSPLLFMPGSIIIDFKKKLMKTNDEEGYKNLGMLEYDKVKENEMKMNFF